MTTTRRVVRLGVAVMGVVLARSALAANAGHPLAEGCELFGVSVIEDTSTRACTKCHGNGTIPGKNHPVDVNYASAAAARGSGSMMELRPVEEVVRRGVFLPDGQIRCVTCHDGRSPWKYGIALPARAKVKPAVVPGDRTTYEDGPGLRERQRELLTSSERYSIAVSAKPLCLVCHALD